MINESIEIYIKRDLVERQNHLKLDEDCIEIGGNSTQFKGLLAYYLKTTIPYRQIYLCHACNNRRCSNPNHLYWGTPSENLKDAYACGAAKSRKGIPLSETHKLNMRKAWEDKKSMRNGGVANRGCL